VPRNWYAAEVQVFDRGGLVPAAVGSPLVVDAGSGARVAPRWTTSCGFPDPELESPTTDQYLEAGAAFATTRTSTPIRGCAPLTDHAPSGDTAVEVPLERLREGIACGAEADAIERFEVRLGEETRSVACGMNARFTSLAPDRSYPIEVAAFSAALEQPSHGARCVASTRSAVRVEAVCNPLSQHGSVEVDVPRLLRLVDQTCGGSVARVTAILTGDDVDRELPADPTACDRPARFDDLEAGRYSVKVSTEFSDGEPGPAFECTAEVSLGSVVGADCVAS
jgi:hypothetical protein